MRIKNKGNWPVIIFSFAMIGCGVNILYRGNIWNVVLGVEKYLVGGTLLVVGIYFLILVFKE